MPPAPAFGTSFDPPSGNPSGARSAPAPGEAPVTANFFLEDDKPTRVAPSVWITGFVLAALLHLFIFSVGPRLFSIGSRGIAPIPLDVHTVDPKKLDQIRKQWKAQEDSQSRKEKALLLNQDKNLPKDKTPPPNARYMSDRNTRVDREQRARDTDVLPKPGSPSRAEQKAQTAQRKSQPKPSAKQRKLELSKLGNLGVPLKLDPVDPEQARENEEREAKEAREKTTGENGASQALADKNLPVSGENLLNTEESVFYSFYARLYESIGPIWQSNVRQVPDLRRIQPGEYTTRVDVVLDREGNLLDVRLIKGSGIAEFDRAVDVSWHRIGRFPNPPSGLLNPKGEVHTGWSFTVEMNQGVGLQYLPPERNY